MALSLLASPAVGSHCGCSTRQAAPVAASTRLQAPLLQHRRLPLSSARRAASGRQTFSVTASAVAAAAAPPAAQQKIRIKLFSYHVELLRESVDLIKAAAEDTGARMAGPVPLPTKKRVYTVLRSPHVNKDSREQFERRTHSRLMDLHELSSQTVDRLMQLDLPAGVDIDVKLL